MYVGNWGEKKKIVMRYEVEADGTLTNGKHGHNMAWGDDDGKTLYLCARSGLY